MPSIIMPIKNCEFCGEKIKAKTKRKRFCNPICQRKHYNRRPEIREKYRIRMREYRKNNPEWREKHRILAVTKYREQRKKYWKDYGSRPEIKERINKRDKIRRKIDKKYAIADRLRRSLNHALSKYSRIGKIMGSKKYGINWKEIIESLKPFPENLKDFEIDHVIPLHTFNLTNPKQVKKAFHSSNLQWLTKEENRKKSGKLSINGFHLNKNLLEIGGK